MRWDTSKTSLRKDIGNIRWLALQAADRITYEDWRGYQNLLEELEMLCSASRSAAQDNVDQQLDGEAR